MTSNGLIGMSRTLVILVTVSLKNETPVGEREPDGSQHKTMKVLFVIPTLVYYHTIHNACH